MLIDFLLKAPKYFDLDLTDVTDFTNVHTVFFFQLSQKVHFFVGQFKKYAYFNEF